ncbi:hypothetical protein D3C79_969030 [compost metagenome]
MLNVSNQLFFIFHKKMTGEIRTRWQHQMMHSFLSGSVHAYEAGRIVDIMEICFKQIGDLAFVLYKCLRIQRGSSLHLKP